MRCSSSKNDCLAVPKASNHQDASKNPLLTPDGRYFIVRGRLWRATNPHLPAHERDTLVRHLMAARRAVRAARGDPARLEQARHDVDTAKIALGERGPVWWDDGAPDYNRKLARNTPYADWFAQQV